MISNLVCFVMRGALGAIFGAGPAGGVGVAEAED
jgi:hypothetical protein